jgi:hypothetical protein
MDRRRRRGRWKGRLAWAGVSLAAVLSCTVAGARAEWVLGVSLEEGVSAMGGPLEYRLARPVPVEGMEVANEVDAVTSASVDAITSASRVSHAGGVHLHLSRGTSGSLVFGLEYVHYRFDLDYDVGRASFDVVGLRLLVLARLALARLRGSPAFTFGFGGYLEVTPYDRAELAGERVDVQVHPVGFGVVVDFNLHPFRFALPGDRGAMVPSLFLRGFRGVVTQLRDELGSDAPLVSVTMGLAVRYEFPSTQGNGRPGR